jgi:drug/metabolite transporter (DMT)-like permease
MGRRIALPLVLSVGIISISSAAVFIKLASDAPPLVIAAARMTIATLVLLPVMSVSRKSKLLRISPRHLKDVALAGAMLAAHFALWITSLKYTSVLSSVVLVTTNPIFVGVGSYFFFKERVGPGLMAGAALAVSGGVLITLADTQSASGSAFGNLLSVGGAIMASGYLMMGRKLRKDVDVLSYMLAVYGIAAILLCAAVFLAGQSPFGYRSSTYVYFLLLGVVPQLLGHGSLNYALKHVTATLIAVFILGEPIGASLFAYFFLGESVTPLQFGGGGLILAGILLASLASPKPQVEPPLA